MKSFECDLQLKNALEDYVDYLTEREQLREKNFPPDPPNDKCQHAILSGVLIENSFKPKVGDYVKLFETKYEKVFLWTHTRNKNSSLVIEVDEKVKHLPFWKNIGHVFKMAYFYYQSFEILKEIDISYYWCYYFNRHHSKEELQIYKSTSFDRLNIFNGIILKATIVKDISIIIDMLLRDDVAFTALSQLLSSMDQHDCCLICELGESPIKKHASHEPEIWEQASFIPNLETAIVQACRCVESILGKPPKKDKQNSFLKHKEKWIELIGINPDDRYEKAKTTYIDYYYKLFGLRNSSAHSYGTIPFELERNQTIEAQCFAAIILDRYICRNVKSEEEAMRNICLNTELLGRVSEEMSTSITEQ